VRAVDTIGAGDTFMASLVDFVAKHGSRDLDSRALEHAGSAAVQAAAITVSRAGADLPWAHEVSAISPLSASAFREVAPVLGDQHGDSVGGRFAAGCS
jgi:bifunctional ADP-heptose synthase (sugar kinase/adenylyltransferase)